MSYASGDVAVTLQTAPDFTGEREWMQRRAAAVGSPIDWPGVWDRGVLAVAGDDAVAIARVGPHVLEVRVAGPNAAALVDMIHRATWLPARWS